MLKKRHIISVFLAVLFMAIMLGSCAHPNAAMGDFRGKYAKVGFMTNDSSLRSEIVLTSRGEVFYLELGKNEFVKKEQLPKLKTKALMLAVQRTGILDGKDSKKGLVSTFYLEYHKRHKVYYWSWGELGFPKEATDVYREIEALKKGD